MNKILKKFNKKILITIIFISIFLTTGCSTDDIYQPFNDYIQEQENEKFTLSDDIGYSDEYGFAYYIEGNVKNNTSNTYSYVQVTFNVYDENNAIVGSCWDNVNNLEGNGTWKIKAICSGDAEEIKSYKLAGFSSW